MQCFLFLESHQQLSSAASISGLESLQRKSLKVWWCSSRNRVGNHRFNESFKHSNCLLVILKWMFSHCTTCLLRVGGFNPMWMSSNTSDVHLSLPVCGRWRHHGYAVMWRAELHVPCRRQQNQPDRQLPPAEYDAGRAEESVRQHRRHRVLQNRAGQSHRWIRGGFLFIRCLSDSFRGANHFCSVQTCFVPLRSLNSVLMILFSNLIIKITLTSSQNA